MLQAGVANPNSPLSDNAFRSTARLIAFRTSGLLSGGFWRFIRMTMLSNDGLVCTLMLLAALRLSTWDASTLSAKSIWPDFKALASVAGSANVLMSTLSGPTYALFQ